MSYEHLIAAAAAQKIANPEVPLTAYGAGFSSVRNLGGNTQTSLCLSNLPFKLSEDEIACLFDKVVSVNILRHRDTNKPRGMAIVQFSDATHCNIAYEQCQSQQVEVEGRLIRGEYSRNDKPAANIQGQNRSNFNPGLTPQDQYQSPNRTDWKPPMAQSNPTGIYNSIRENPDRPPRDNNEHQNRFQPRPNNPAPYNRGPPPDVSIQGGPHRIYNRDNGDFRQVPRGESGYQREGAFNDRQSGGYEDRRSSGGGFQGRRDFQNERQGGGGFQDRRGGFNDRRGGGGFQDRKAGGPPPRGGFRGGRGGGSYRERSPDGGPRPSKYGVTSACVRQLPTSGRPERPSSSSSGSEY